MEVGCPGVWRAAKTDRFYSDTLPLLAACVPGLRQETQPDALTGGFARRSGCYFHNNRVPDEYHAGKRVGNALHTSTQLLSNQLWRPLLALRSRRVDSSGNARNTSSYMTCRGM
jgi:hypothetical protein